MALREAAIELGIPEGTVKSHLRYAIIDTKRGAVIVLLAWKILTKDNVNRDGITRKVRYTLYFGDISNECEWRFKAITAGYPLHAKKVFLVPMICGKIGLKEFWGL